MVWSGININMVYKIDNDGALESIGQRPAIRAPKLRIQRESKIANLLVLIVKLLLSIYDFLSLPIYFILLRPDRQAKEADRVRSERVDANTWIKNDPSPHESSYLLQDLKCGRRKAQKHMGATLCEIFANSIQEFGSNPCLGYRALVTCPVLTLNENGESVMENKSFRSDYTWYTYAQIGGRVQDIASGLYYHSLRPQARALFIADTSVEWFCSAQACFQLASQLVLAPDISNTSTLRQILIETEIKIIFTSCDRLALVCKLFEEIKAANINKIHIKAMVLIDWQFSIDLGEPTFAQLHKSTKGFVDRLLSIGQIEESGVEHPIELRCTQSLRQLQVGKDMTNMVEDNLRKISFNDELGEQSNVDGQQQCRLRRSYSFKSSQMRNSICRSSPELELERTEEILRSIEIKRSADDANLQTVRPKTRVIAKEDMKGYHRRVKPKPEDPAMVVYSHGTLGQIKPVMLSHRYLARSTRFLFLDGMVHGQDVHCNTLPVDNVMEFMTEICVFSHGGSIGYSCNSNTLFYGGKDLFQKDTSDLEALNPTFILTRPYMLERLRTSIHNHLRLDVNPLVSFLLTSVLYDYKKYWARRYFGTPIVDRVFCSQLKNLFGKRIRYILCNGATDCDVTKDFFAFMVGVPVIELYGPNEAIASLISVDDIWDHKRQLKVWARNLTLEEESESIDDFHEMQLMPPKVDRNIFKADTSRNLLISSSILCPTLGSRIRLEDWEDFRISDRPYPRGRLVIGGDVICSGYFRRAELTRLSFYTDSNRVQWYRTDDIARVFPNGSFEIISNLSDMVKMLDEQFVSLSQIEHILRNSQFVDNVCALCGEDRRFVVALVVPNLRRLALKSPGEANLKMAIGDEPEPEELIDVEFRREVCNDRLLCEFVTHHLIQLMDKFGLQSMFIRFHLVPDIWTPDNELVTPSFEPKRDSIQKFYAADIQSIFRMECKQAGYRLSSRLTKANAKNNYSNPARQNQTGLYAKGRFSY